jgi:hypothetical protein
MFSIRTSIILTVFSFVMAGLAATASAGLSNSGSSAVSIQTLKGCAFLTANTGGNPVETIKLMDTQAPNAKGKLLFQQKGFAYPLSIKLGTKGIALIAFPVSTSASATATVKLATRPEVVRTFHFNFSLTAANNLTQPGCVPR